MLETVSCKLILYFQPNARRNTADFPRSKFIQHHVSTRSLPAKNNTKGERKSKKNSDKRDYERESSSEDSDKDENVLSPATVSVHHSVIPPPNSKH